MKTYTAPENYTAAELADLIRQAYDHAEATGEAVQVRAAGRVQYTHTPHPSLAAAQAARQTAGAHLSLCRRLCVAVQRDIAEANEHRESVAPATLELYERLMDDEQAAAHAYRLAADAVDAMHARRALRAYDLAGPETDTMEQRYSKRTATTQGITSEWMAKDPNGQWVIRAGEWVRLDDTPAIADLRRALRAYDLAGPLTRARRQALGEVLTLARQLTEE